MTEYATSRDMDAHFGAEEVLVAFDRDGDGTADVNVMPAALSAATEEINSYVAVRFDLPLASVPRVLVAVCCDIAMYNASINSPAMTEDKQTRYSQRVKWLEKLAKGLVTLGPQEEQVVIQDHAELSTDTEARLFSRTKMRGLM